MIWGSNKKVWADKKVNISYAQILPIEQEITDQFVTIFEVVNSNMK